MKKYLRTVLGTVARLLPPAAPEWIYSTLLRGPLRRWFNRLMLALLPESVTLPDGIVVLNRTDPIVSGALTFGVYEPYETSLFRSLVNPGMVVVDIGANVGYYTVIAASRVGPGGRVIAFEPEPENYSCLERSIEQNHFSNTTLHQQAVADRAGFLTLHLYDSNKGKHSLVKDVHDAAGFSTEIRVPTVTLDEALSKLSVDRVDVIKMDIEGAESLALLGMSRALTTCHTLFMEFTPASIQKAGHDPSDVLASLRAYGFTIAVIDEQRASTHRITDDPEFIRSIPHARCANLIASKTPLKG